MSRARARGHLADVSTTNEPVLRPPTQARPSALAVESGAISEARAPRDERVSPGLTPQYVLAVQQLVGNRAAGALVASRNSAASPGSITVQRTAVQSAIDANKVEAISALSDTDIAGATSDDRAKMITIVLGGGGGDVLRRLWDSFGAGLAAAATAHEPQWDQSFKQFPDVMRSSKEVKTLQAAFKDDICTVAQGYLTDNDGVVTKEMGRLGVPEQEGGGQQPTAEQDAAVQQTQAQAQKLSEAQKHREELRQVEVAYHRKQVEQGGSDLPEGGAENLETTYEPVYFDPDNKFDAASQPTDYSPGLKAWDETNAEHVRLTNVISSYLMANPSLYALVRSDTSGQPAGALATMSPQEARKTLGDQLRHVRENITKTRPMVPGLALQMTEIQHQLVANNVAASAHGAQDWSKPFLHVIADDVAAQQQPGPWWEQLGLATLEMAAFVVAGLASGGIGPVLLAGGQAAISVGKYEALEAASRANVTPDTVLIKDGQVQVAAVEAAIAVTMAFLAAVTALRAAFAARAASQAGQALIKELGEDVARRLLIELSPDAVQALKDKLGVKLLQDLVGADVGGGTIQKMVAELSATEVQALLDKAKGAALGPLLERIGGGRLASSLLDKCEDAGQLSRFLDRVPDPKQLDELLNGVAKPDLSKLEAVLAQIGEPGQGTLSFNIGGELEASAGQVIINPGRAAMSIPTLRQLKPGNLVVDARAERIPFPDGCGKLVQANRLPDSIDWDQAASEFARVLGPGGRVNVATHFSGAPLRNALKAKGLVVEPPPPGVTDQWVKATKP